MENDMAEMVSVLSVFDAEKRAMKPLRIKWHGRVYKVSEVAMHFTREIKGHLYHIYAVSCRSVNFVLHFDTTTLFWTVEQMQDSEQGA